MYGDTYYILIGILKIPSARFFPQCFTKFISFTSVHYAMNIRSTKTANYIFDNVKTCIIFDTHIMQHVVHERFIDLVSLSYTIQ